MTMQWLEQFNWKKHPENVLYQALPLGGLGLAYMLAGSILHLAWGGDPWYLVIFVVLSGFGGLVLYGMLRNFRRLQNMSKESEEMSSASQWRDWETYSKLRAEQAAKEARKDRLLMKVIVWYGGMLVAAVLIIPIAIPLFTRH